MSNPVPPKRLALINQLLAGRSRRIAGLPGSIATSLLSRYLMGVALEEMPAHDAATLASAAEAHLRMAVRRRPSIMLRIFNPITRTDGFETPHTAIMVVSPDMPFLVDSALRTIERSGRAIHLVIHPVLCVERRCDGTLRRLSEARAQSGITESWQYYEIDREDDPSRLKALEHSLRETLTDVADAIRDRPALENRIRDIARQLPSRVGGKAAEGFSEAKALLEWLLEGNFVVLAAQDYDLRRGRQHDEWVPDPTSALGLDGRARTGGAAPEALTGAARRAARLTTPLVIGKSRNPSFIHAGTHLDCISIKRFTRDGRVVGEHRLLGHWSARAHHQHPSAIPVVRKRVAEVLGYFGGSIQDHDGRALLRALERYPLDELFQISTPSLIRAVRSIVNLYDRRTVRLFGRQDRARQYWSGLLYLPKDAYDAATQRRIEAFVLAETGGETIESHVELSDAVLARIQFIVGGCGSISSRTEKRLEDGIADSVRTWRDRLRSALVERSGEAAALRLLARYLQGIPASYQAETDAVQALDDIAVLETINSSNDSPIRRLYRADGSPANHAHLRLYRHGNPRPIADVLPTLENFGLKLLTEHLYQITPVDAAPVWIQDFEFQSVDEKSIDLAAVGQRLLDAIGAVWSDATDNDRFNQLVLAAGLTWNQALVLRAYCRWLTQATVRFSLRYMAEVLIKNPPTTLALTALFEAQFDPSLTTRRRTVAIAVARERLDSALAAVTRLDEDRILRALSAAIDATMRTNSFQRTREGRLKPYLALKLDPRKVPGVPEPLPHHEIWVHSARFEGVHLRKGQIARGGIRWSDRYEDFRVEILGLMKAQHVKNSLIVPVGAKGGFVCRRLPTIATARMAEVTACYREFISGLLDLTDNIADGRVVPPTDTVRRDADDTYMVVAADKGTATFSDTANAIAAEYGYWLGDAFASGGSAGYDHKKLAITARGAWVCVRRHFLEAGIDVTKQDITVAGIGDMSGDVFGNGLLQSKHQCLVAAFNHQHIFIDPSPDPTKSFRERRRLFGLAGSTWADYDRAALSRGGGVWSRTDKSIRLPLDARNLLGLTTEYANPDEVIKCILRLPVDLLWNGGIGTYVKASDETHADVGDRANDTVRINGRDVRARVVGEGGNLGFSQRGRIEYALSGGRINTDSIDNSGGVNCSDVEVNVKILLRIAEQHAELGRAQRDRLLVRMSDDVAALVLRNNQLQSQAISLLEAQSAHDSARHGQAIEFLEANTDLNRSLEYLPTPAILTARHQAGRGLTRPELSILLSYSKIWTQQQLLASDAPEDPYLARELARYFPDVLAKRYLSLLGAHPLKRQIIATAMTNSLVNRMGPVFALQLTEESGASIGAIARAYTIAREITNMRVHWLAIEALDGKVSTGLQYECHLATTRILTRCTQWLLTHYGNDLAIDRLVGRLQPIVSAALSQLQITAPHRAAPKATAPVENIAGVSGLDDVSRALGALEHLPLVLDMADLSLRRRWPLDRVVKTFLALSHALHLDRLAERIDRLPTETRWQSVSRSAAREDLDQLHADMTEKLLSDRRGHEFTSMVSAWLAHRPQATAHFHSIQQALTSQADLAVITAALHALKRIATE